METTTATTFFCDGSIHPDLIARELTEFAAGSGAHSVFIGRVRPDMNENREVIAIEYTLYEMMAEEIMQNISSEVKKKFDLLDIRILHSVGTVASGENSLLVIVSAAHRLHTFAACSEIVDRIKSEVPVWGKEIFSDHAHRWKKTGS